MEIACPNKLEIGGLTLTVSCNPQEDMMLMKSGWVGRFSENDSIISVASHITDDAKEIVLWHEIVHAIICEFGVILPKENDEDNTDAIAGGIVQVLKQLGIRTRIQLDTEVPDVV